MCKHWALGDVPTNKGTVAPLIEFQNSRAAFFTPAADAQQRHLHRGFMGGAIGYCSNVEAT